MVWSVVGVVWEVWRRDGSQVRSDGSAVVRSSNMEISLAKSRNIKELLHVEALLPSFRL